MERDKRRVLIADAPELESAWRACLVAHEVTFACSLAQVCRDLERMLACSAGLHPALPLQPSESRER